MFVAPVLGCLYVWHQVSRRAEPTDRWSISTFAALSLTCAIAQILVIAIAIQGATNIALVGAISCALVGSVCAYLAPRHHLSLCCFSNLSAISVAAPFLFGT